MKIYVILSDSENGAVAIAAFKDRKKADKLMEAAHNESWYLQEVELEPDPEEILEEYS